MSIPYLPAGYEAGPLGTPRAPMKEAGQNLQIVLGLSRYFEQRLKAPVAATADY
jgi:hypothetical protein